ncbi:hypothetical protein HK104_008573, partial [Borealophlyctis nickersoniae]
MSAAAAGVRAASPPGGPSMSSYVVGQGWVQPARLDYMVSPMFAAAPGYGAAPAGAGSAYGAPGVGDYGAPDDGYGGYPQMPQQAEGIDPVGAMLNGGNNAQQQGGGGTIGRPTGPYYSGM